MTTIAPDDEAPRRPSASGAPAKSAADARAVKTPRPVALDWLLLAALVVLWGSAYAMTHVGVEAVSPAALVAARLVIGALVLGGAMLAMGERPPRFVDRRAWGSLALIGACGTLLPFLLITWAQREVPSALAAVYIAAAPLAVAVLCHLLIPGERVTGRRAFGLLVGFAGVCLLFAPALTDTGIGAAPLIDQALLLIAAILYASASVLVRLAGPSLHPVTMAFGFVAAAAVMSLPLTLLGGPMLVGPIETSHVLAVLGLGIGCTGVANLVYVVSIRRVGPVFMSNVGNLAPFWSILIGAVFLNEALPPTLYAALATILVGVFLVQRR